VAAPASRPSRGAQRKRATNGAVPKPKVAAALKSVTYTSSLPPSGPLPREFGEGVKALEAALGKPVWMLVQTGSPSRSLSTLDYTVLRTFWNARDDLAADGHVALLIDSPGGLGDAAYQIARMLQRDGGFTVVVARYAKSAATLLSLGAVEAIMGEDAEIGPLDAQMWDPEREEPASALNEVQALDQLHTVALEHLDKTMVTMLGGMRKRTDVLLPIAAKFVSDMMRPMLEKIDAVHYAKQARTLAVAEHYAIRLLQHAGVAPQQARQVADRLVNRYPEHGFVIDRQEVLDEGLLPLVDASDEVKDAVSRVERALWDHQITAFGKLEERT
jgi:hypothetical protein